VSAYPVAPYLASGLNNGFCGRDDETYAAVAKIISWIILHSRWILGAAADSNTRYSIQTNEWRP